MDDAIKYAGALIFLAAAIIYVTIKNKGKNKEKKYQYEQNQKRENQEIDIELVIYKKEKDRLEERLRRKELSWDDFVRLRINLDEQHEKNIEQIRKSSVK